MEITQLRCIIHNFWPEVESAGCQDNEEVRKGCRIRTLDLLFVNATGILTRENNLPNQMTDSHGLCEKTCSTLA